MSLCGEMWDEALEVWMLVGGDVGWGTRSLDVLWGETFTLDEVLAVWMLVG